MGIVKPFCWLPIVMYNIRSPAHKMEALGPLMKTWQGVSGISGCGERGQAVCRGDRGRCRRQGKMENDDYCGDPERERQKKK